MKILLSALNSKYVHTNLAVRYIKSYCGIFDIDIKEYTINDSIHSIVNGIYVENPDIVGFSCYIWNISLVLKVCSSLKKILPKCLILLGGPEVSFDSRELMEEHGCIDFIIKGEGEVSSFRLFRYLKDGDIDIKDIGGLVYRSEGVIYENAEGELIGNLDQIPFPYEGETGWFNSKIVYYESSRGCPYNCSYCLSSTIKGVRFFSLERVKKDLMFFINNEIKLVKFVDRTFNCGRNYIEILKFLVENKKKTRFHFEISGDILSQEILDFLSTVPEGLFQFEIGVQSTNFDVLSKVARKSDLEKLSHNVLCLRDKDNIPLHLDLIAGLPGEDYESFKKSFNDCYNLMPHMLQLGFLKLLKGSSIRENADILGIIYDEYPPYEVLYTMDITYDELCELKRAEDTVDRYYNSGRFASSIRYLCGKFETPFLFYKALSDYQEKNSKEGAGISNVEQYKLLYGFCNLYDECDTEVIIECLAFDFLKQGRNPYLPDFLHSKNQLEKENIWGILDDENIIKRYFPHYECETVKELMKHIRIRIFSFDILNYLKSGIIDFHQKIIVFDYGTKDGSGEVLCFSID